MAIYNIFGKKIIFAALLFVFATNMQAQDATNTSDEVLKEKIYNQYKAAVLNYSMKNFDSMFLDFLAKQNDKNYTFTREEFYTFTVKIATFSDRLAKLYPARKAEAEANKKEWLSKTYEDYLKFKEEKK
jgi:hypothetical protein